jgi:hypothetical protein
MVYLMACFSVHCVTSTYYEVEETGKETVYLDVLFHRFPEWIRHSTKEISEYVFGPRF